MRRDIKNNPDLAYNVNTALQGKKKLSKKNVTLENSAVSRDIEYVSLQPSNTRVLDKIDSQRRLPAIEQAMSPGQRNSHISERNYGSPYSPRHLDSSTQSYRYKTKSNAAKEVTQQQK